MKIDNHSQVKQLLQSTISLINDCTLDNGAIVAANSTKSYYSPEAKNYFYVWPRDASFTCVAADVLGIDDIQDGFFDWCLNRAEGFKTEGVFYEKYYPNGLKALPRFQPDQVGVFLYAIWHHLQYHKEKKGKEKYINLIELAANGICAVWDTDHFTQKTNDLWEERTCFPDLEENYSYALACCIKGLKCANEIFPNENWIDIADQMKKRLDEHYINFFVRSFGKIPDTRIDASILGLVYPFGIYDPSDERVLATVNEIETKLVRNGGVYRYEGDDYDGWMCDGEHRKKGAGAWPLLNFWMAIVFNRMGEKEKAEKYFNWVFENTKDEFLPEQIFENNIQKAVSPLLWSHVMFVLAAKELGFF